MTAPYEVGDEIVCLEPALGGIRAYLGQVVDIVKASSSRYVVEATLPPSPAADIQDLVIEVDRTDDSALDQVDEDGIGSYFLPVADVADLFSERRDVVVTETYLDPVALERLRWERSLRDRG
jgi:hypothetical protein